MPIKMFAVLGICAAAAGGTTAIHGWEHEVLSPRDAASTKTLETALQRFERDIAGKSGRSEARSSKPKEIVVVGSKIKEVERASRKRPGRFKGVQGMDSQTDVVEYRDGAPPSLPRLQSAVRGFERSAGPNSPCVRTCRARQRQCMARCRAKLRKSRMSGRCICAHVQARCLVQAAKRNRCHPPDPGRRGRLRRR